MLDGKALAPVDATRKAAWAVVGIGLAVWFDMASAATTVGFTSAQADRGAALYAQHCRACHGAQLSDGAHAPPIKGDAFRVKWTGQPASNLLNYLSTNMPPRMASMLSAENHSDVMAFILEQNGERASAAPLPSGVSALDGVQLPAWPSYASGGGLAPGAVIPPPVPKPDPFATLRPVTDEMLTRPNDGDWLMWRRTYDAYGHSPLDQINVDNVSGLRLAWSWTLPQGPNASTPVVHDGVIFLHGHGDRVQALDAATGELLWQYVRRLPHGVTANHKRSIAIHGELLFVPTSDAHVLALHVRTGDVVWDAAISDAGGAVQLISGPLVARGKVMIGTAGARPGGNYIVGLDAATGREAWRFYVLQRPQATGDTWNDIPLEARNGGSVWLPGSYDPIRNLAFFAPGNTYDTKPLRDRVSKRGVSNNGLYLDSTLALNPDTGKLVWSYQHQANDQWDLDWAFERQSLQLRINGQLRDVVVTAGKTAIFDLLSADDGRYLSSIDLGLQNIVKSIDPRTGFKQVDETLVPGDGATKMICPHVSGGRGWLPTSYDTATRTLVVPLTEACMDLVPAAEGESTILSTRVRWTVRPRPGSDGLYGRLQAVDPQNGETRWVVRERAPMTAATLATAGGVVFSGSLDRYLKAYDIRDGKLRWSARLNDAPSAPPITYAAGGIQYLAVIVGPGGYQSLSYGSLVPEIRNPSDAGTLLWVFALPPQEEGSSRESRRPDVCAAPCN